MISPEVVLTSSPLTPSGLQSLSALCSFARFLTLAIFVRQCWEVICVSKAHRQLFFATRFITAVAFAPTFRSLFLSHGSVHEAAKRVIARLLTALDQSITFRHLKEIEERIHNVAKYLRLNLFLPFGRVDAMLEQLVSLEFVVHYLQYLIRQLFSWWWPGHLWLPATRLLSSLLILTHSILFRVRAIDVLCVKL